MRSLEQTRDPSPPRGIRAEGSGAFAPQPSGTLPPPLRSSSPQPSLRRSSVSSGVGGASGFGPGFGAGPGVQPGSPRGSGAAAARYAAGFGPGSGGGSPRASLTTITPQLPPSAVGGLGGLSPAEVDAAYASALSGSGGAGAATGAAGEGALRGGALQRLMQQTGCAWGQLQPDTSASLLQAFIGSLQVGAGWVIGPAGSCSVLLPPRWVRQGKNQRGKRKNYGLRREVTKHASQVPLAPFHCAPVTALTQ